MYWLVSFGAVRCRKLWRDGLERMVEALAGPEGLPVRGAAPPGFPSSRDRISFFFVSFHYLCLLPRVRFFSAYGRPG